MKKIGYILLMFSLILCLGGCQKNSNTITETLNEVIEKVYANIPEDEMFITETIEVTSANQEYYLGSSNFSYKEALASEPVMSSIAHSVVLVRVNETKDIEKIKAEIKENIDPYKWVCVGVEDKNVIVESNKDLIILIMDNKYATIIRDNFLNLK